MMLLQKLRPVNVIYTSKKKEKKTFQIFHQILDIFSKFSNEIKLKS